jgi:hypothetical protein
MTTKLFFTLAISMAITALANAAWVPTGYTKFTPPATVQGKAGETVTMKAQLLYQLKDSEHPAKKDWQPLAGATVNFYVSGRGIVGQAPCPQGKTDNRAWARSSWTIPNPPKTTRYTFTVQYTGGRKAGVVLKPCHDNGRIDAVTF